jgi:hypothetical protein
MSQFIFIFMTIGFFENKYLHENKLSIEKINTIKLHFTTYRINDKDNLISDVETDVWMTPDKYRIRENKLSNKYNYDRIWKNGVQTSKLGPHQDGSIALKSKVRTTKSSISSFNIARSWFFGTCMFTFGYDGKVLPLIDSIHAGFCNIEKIEETNGLTKIFAKSASKDKFYEFFIDSKNGYLISRRIIYKGNNSSVIDTDIRVTEYIEPVPGIFFPRTIELRDGTGLLFERHVFKDVVINEPIPDAVFDTDQLNTGVLIDLDEKTRAKTDSSGKIQGEKTKLSTPLSSSNLPKAEIVQKKFDTEEERTDFFRWWQLIPFALAFGLIVYRTRMNRRT